MLDLSSPDDWKSTCLILQRPMQKLKERPPELTWQAAIGLLLQQFGWDSVRHSDPLLTLLFELQCAGSESDNVAQANPYNYKPLLAALHFQDTVVYHQGRAEEMSANSVFVLSELICPQICFIHGLTSSASQPLNNWRNYQARGSKAPQKCVMPLSKACRKGKKKKEGPLNSELCVQPHNPVMFHLHTKKHTKLKHSGWWCHKWQALTGRISIAHNSGSPCMSDKFMILSKCCSPIFLCIRMGVFGVARFHHAVWLVSLIQRMWLTQH